MGMGTCHDEIDSAVPTDLGHKEGLSPMSPGLFSLVHTQAFVKTQLISFAVLQKEPLLESATTSEPEPLTRVAINLCLPSRKFTAVCLQEDG